MLSSLRTRLALIFIVLTITPLVIVGLMITSRGNDVLQSQSVTFQNELAQRAAINLESFFKERQAELLALTDIYGLDTLAPNAQRDVLLALLSHQTAYYQLALAGADAQETIRITRGEAITPADFINRADDPLYQAALTTRQVSYSPVYFNPQARDRMITIAIPIENLFSGQIENVLIAEVRFQGVGDAVLRTLDLPEGDDVYIIDSNGFVLVHNNPNLVIRETLFDLPSEGRHPGLSGTDVVLASHPIELGDQALIVVAETSYRNATALANDLSRIAAIITAIALLFTLVITLLSVNQIVKPIIKVSEVATAIQSGNLNARADEKGAGEIAILGRTFNQMTAAIQKREADLMEQADALRIATARAKEAARVKGEFLANVSHELRTPLNAIIGFSDMLLAGMSGPMTEKQAHKMERLKENGLRLLALINDLLDLTRIESGRLEVVDKAFSPRHVAERTAAQMESIALESKLAFETSISPDMPALVYGDEKRVEQVIINLLSNAFKFTKEGSVTLSLSANQAEKTWNIEVIDTGIGIPPHAVNVIFEEFRQLDGSYSRAYTGSGLGLAITRNLVRIMGGKIAVKSTPDEGSTFTVVLPMHVGETTEHQVLEAALA